jgi:hypothetical protein
MRMSAILILAVCGSLPFYSQAIEIGDTNRYGSADHEQFLLPPPEISEGARNVQIFSIGAAFEPTGALCAEGSGLFSLIDNSVVLVFPQFFRPLYEDRRDDDKNEKIWLFGNQQCRFEVQVRKSILSRQRWLGLILSPALKVSKKTEGRNRPGVNIGDDLKSRMDTPPAAIAAELSYTRFLGSVVAAMFEPTSATCPEGAGLIEFQSTGLRLVFPWAQTKSLQPGFRRSPEERATTIILTSSNCRVELRVSKLVFTGGNWALVPLAKSEPSPTP